MCIRACQQDSPHNDTTTTCPTQPTRKRAGNLRPDSDLPAEDSNDLEKLANEYMRTCVEQPAFVPATFAAAVALGDDLFRSAGGWLGAERRAARGHA